MADRIRASRRHVVQGLAVAGVAGPILVACGSDDEGGGGGAASGPTIACGCHGSRFSAEDGSVVNGPAAEPLAEKSVTVDGDQVTVDGDAVATTAEIPVGGGAVLKDKKVVVTQPEAGTFKAFTAVCTHQGCIVQEVQQA
jgi:Rieske Fe-S protein